MAKRENEINEEISGSLIVVKRCKEDENLWYPAENSSEDVSMDTDSVQQRFGKTENEGLKPVPELDEKTEVDVNILEEKVKRMNINLAELKVCYQNRPRKQFLGCES